MSTIKQDGRNCNPSVFLTFSSLLERSGVSRFFKYPFAVKIIENL